MRRAVLDANVYVSALLAPAGGPAQILERWADGEFDVIVSPLLLAELERVLRRPKFKASIPEVQIDVGCVRGRLPSDRRPRGDCVREFTG